MTANSTERIQQAEAQFAAGQLAFERGRYRDAIEAFEAGVALADASSLLGGSIQLWLMNAYSAAGRQSDAIASGQALAHHPDRDIRKQSQRVLEILQAPQLQRRADWLTPIPDLSELDRDRSAVTTAYQPPKSPSTPSPNPSTNEDLNAMNTRENGFLWIALGLVAITLSGIWIVRG
jgi:tetratricopeptide (TPR) repeat protein